MLLHRRGARVVGEREVAGDDLAEVDIAERGDALGDLVTSRLDGNVVVLVEVDAAVVAREELAVARGRVGWNGERGSDTE